MRDDKNLSTTGLPLCSTGHQHPSVWLRRRALGWLMDSGKLPMYNLARKLELEMVA